MKFIAHKLVILCSAYQLSYSLVQLLLYGYCNFCTFQMVLLSFHLGVFSTTQDVLCLQEINAQLRQVTTAAQRNRRWNTVLGSFTSLSGGISSSDFWLLAHVSTFCRRHRFILRQMLFANGAIVAPFFALAFAVNVPCSLSLHAMLLSGSITDFQAAMAFSLLALQLFGAIGAVLMIDRFRAAVTSSSSAIYHLQGALVSGSGSSAQCLVVKLQLHDFYGQLTGVYRLKLSYSVGSLWSITKTAFAQVKRQW